MAHYYSSPYYTAPAPAPAHGYPYEEPLAYGYGHPRPQYGYHHHHHRHAPPPEHHYARSPSPIQDLDAEERILAQRLAAIRAQKAKDAEVAQRRAYEAISREAEESRRNAELFVQQLNAREERHAAARRAALERRAQLEQQVRFARAAKEEQRLRAQEARATELANARRWNQRIPQVLNGANDVCAALSSIGLLPPSQTQTQSRPCARHQERSTAQGLNELLARFGVDNQSERKCPRVPDQVNDVLGKLLGFTIGQEEEEDKAEAKTPAPAPSPAPEAAPETKEESNDVIPKELNDLLSSILGFRIEKASDEDIAAATSNVAPPTATATEAPAATEKQESTSTPAPSDESRPVLPKEINELLQNMFGFSIEPLQASTSAGPSTTTADPSDDLESYAKDAFSQQALENDIKTTAEAKVRNASTGKGKGVAEGERTKDASAPAPAATEPKSDALDKLSKLSAELAELRSHFTFPQRLSFGPSSDESSTAAPPLLYNSTNAPYHLHAHQLLQLLVKADAIESNGDKTVRKARKDVVRRVEKELEDLEAEREKVWVEVKKDPRAARVEDSDDESESGSETSSVREVDNKTYAEAVAEVKGHSDEVKHDQVAEEAADKPAEEQEGYTVPEVKDEVASEEQSSKPEAFSETKSEEVTEAKQEAEPKTEDDKKSEHGYEML